MNFYIWITTTQVKKFHYSRRFFYAPTPSCCHVLPKEISIPKLLLPQTSFSCFWNLELYWMYAFVSVFHDTTLYLSLLCVAVVLCHCWIIFLLHEGEKLLFYPFHGWCTLDWFYLWLLQMMLLFTFCLLVCIYSALCVNMCSGHIVKSGIVGS